MTHELQVWLFKDFVGTLALHQGRLSFQYRAEWLQQPRAMALSQSLPLQREVFDDAQARPFFAGLLPEGQMRRLIARDLQVSAQNDFALLDQLGGDCAGAITFLRPRQALPPADDAVQWLNAKSLEALLKELPQCPMLAGKNGMRLSLAGAQDKLPVVVKRDQRRLLPRARKRFAIQSRTRTDPASGRIQLFIGRALRPLYRYPRTTAAFASRRFLSGTGGGA